MRSLPSAITGMLLLVQVLTSPAKAESPSVDWLPGPGAVLGASPVEGVVDEPRAGAVLKPEGTLRLAGWVVDRSASGWAGVDDVEVLLGLMNDGGQPLGRVISAQPRPDVAAALGDPYWTNSGWAMLVPLSSLPSGTLTLNVYAHLPAKGWWFRQVRVAVGNRPVPASAPSSAAGKPAPSPSVTVPEQAAGFDASFPDCGAPTPATLAFGIVGVNGGRAFTPNPCLAQQYVWALNASSPTQPRLSLYLNTGNPGPGVSPYWPQAGTTTPRICDGSASNDCAYDYGWLAAQDAVARARLVVGGLASQVPWWLDVETENSWSADQANNSADLEGTVAALRANGIALIGIYSLAGEWEELIGYGPSNAPFAGLPNWRPGATAASETAAWCQRTVTGGVVQYAQYPRGGHDADVPCP